MTLNAPNSMQELIDWCLRKLGGENIFQPPVGALYYVEVTPTQCVDRATEALERLQHEHYNGYQEYAIAVPTTVGQDSYVLPKEVLSITSYMQIDDHTSLFALDYQIKQSIGLRLSQFDIVTIELMYEHLKQLNIMIGQKIDFNFNQLTHTFQLRSAQDRDRTLFLTAHIMIEPEVESDLWNDIWLKRYTYELIKQQWGQNLKKFGNVNLPGGIQINGTDIYTEATEALEKLEDELQTKYSKPPKFFFG